ncbi:MAG: antitoxin [Rudaea sp.]|uniref:type II toxin-antitoxin system RelB family antitoxin n=1 Tax=Rudaea sp. TaxID=2136325 RepID=UPI0039E3DA06
MNAKLDPLVSEFENAEQAALYDEWLRAKIEAAANSKKPRVPHDQVMTEMHELLQSKCKAREGGG